MFLLVEKQEQDREQNGNRTSKQSAVMSKNNNNNNKHTRSTPISEDELVRHVTSQYITGVGGVLYKAMARSSKDLRSDDHAKLMQSLNRHPALVLNADYQPISYLPLSMWHWQEAVKSVFTGKVTVVDTYPNIVIHTASLEIPLPSVIALNEYVPPASKAKPAFTKRNVFLRDEYKCQYCNDRFTTNDLSLDHVVPRCRGGRLDWTNAVTCCRRCNGKKGSLSIKQLRSVGMKLVREPSVPTQFQLHAIAGRMLPRKVHPSWAPFLGLDNNDDDDDEKAMASEGLSKGYFEEVAYHAKYR
mmetsp:Transcript_24525/g.36004  ORF Transcript_24525/g.36004 Transcript_24525/m.36004 type:complete len:300 (-) Transcript_24525:437-1336(-)